MHITIKTNIPAFQKNQSVVEILLKLSQKYQELGFYNQVGNSSYYVITIGDGNVKDKTKEEFIEEIAEFLKKDFPTLNLVYLETVIDVPRSAECDPCTLAEFLSVKVKSVLMSKLSDLCSELRAAEYNIQVRFQRYYHEHSKIASLQEDLKSNPQMRAKHLVAVEMNLQRHAYLLQEKLWLAACNFLADYQEGKVSPHIIENPWMSEYFKFNDKSLVLSEVNSQQNFIKISFEGNGYIIGEVKTMAMVNIAMNLLKDFLSAKKSGIIFEGLQTITEPGPNDKFSIVLHEAKIRPSETDDFISKIRRALLNTGLIEFSVGSIYYHIQPSYQAVIKKDINSGSNQNSPPSDASTMPRANTQLKFDQVFNPPTLQK